MKIALSRVAVCGVISLFAQSALATDLPNRTNTPALPLSLMNYSGGNDWTRYEISPNWSRELGWSLKGAFGSYITNDLAVGAIVEYGQDKREYLTNAGVRLSDKISFIGTIGMLEEHREFVANAGKETVQQMEYGASLKGAYEFGVFRGFELNGYLADANAKSDDIETGKLYGTQILTNVNLSDSTRLKIGGGYEWLRWDEGEENNAFSFRADGIQKITNNLNAVANVKLGASEYVYGGGLAYNLGDRGNTNVIGINYEHIEGKNGIQSDQRVQLSWTMGMGVGPTSLSSSNLSKTDSKSNSLNFDQLNAPASTLLTDVMKRPEFLPKRVLARAKSGGACQTGQASVIWGAYSNFFGLDALRFNIELDIDSSLAEAERTSGAVLATVALTINGVSPTEFRHDTSYSVTDVDSDGLVEFPVWVTFSETPTNNFVGGNSYTASIMYQAYCSAIQIPVSFTDWGS